MRPRLTARPGLTLFLAAALLRLTAAALTEAWPIFPTFYYTDAREHHAVACAMVESWKAGDAPQARLTPAKRAYDYLVAASYRMGGCRPLVPRAANALLAALAVLCLYRFAGTLLPPRGAFLFGLLLALWPSHVFTSSQNTKEALCLLLIAVAALCYGKYLIHLERRTADPWRPALLAGGAAALLLLSLFKSFFLFIFCAGAAPGFLAAARTGAWRRPSFALAWALGAAALAAPVPAYQPFSEHVYTKLFKPPTAQAERATDELSLLPYFHPGRSFLPRTPQEISQFRDHRQRWDQIHAEKTMGRRVQTQLFHGLTFESWLDVALHLPRGAFYALFMPLPGLYPMEGSAGRLLAGLENTLLLALFVAALYGWFSGARPPLAWLATGLFLAPCLASAVFEFDLGSAGRHKLEYLPFIMLFAFRVQLPFLAVNDEK